MAPKSEFSDIISDQKEEKAFETKSEVKEKSAEYKIEVVWASAINLFIVHILGIYGFYVVSTGRVSWPSIIYTFYLSQLSMFANIAGSHRLWCHRSFKVKFPLKVILLILQTASGHNDVYYWVRYHRIHHKYSETDADPTNVNRGFFFAHLGWLMCEKHPLVEEKGKGIDMSDLTADPWIRYQRKFYAPLVVLTRGLIFVAIPMYLWNENIIDINLLQAYSFLMTVHQACLANSAAHITGYRTYDKTIGATENRLLTYLTMGAGYHNYHHVFPYDYAAAEFGWQQNFAPSTALIDLFARIGWAYDLKTASKRVIEMRLQRTGDLSQRQNINFWWDLIIGTVLMHWQLILFFILRNLTVS